MHTTDVRRWFSFAGGIVVIEPMVKIYLEGLCSTWHKTLESQKPADLRLMSERIWENTLKPVSRLLNRHTTPHEFCANVTGAYLRWEVIGILVTLVTLVARSLKGKPRSTAGATLLEAGFKMVLIGIQMAIQYSAHTTMHLSIEARLPSICTTRLRCACSSATTSAF